MVHNSEIFILPHQNQKEDFIQKTDKDEDNKNKY